MSRKVAHTSTHLQGIHVSSLVSEIRVCLLFLLTQPGHTTNAARLLCFEPFSLPSTTALALNASPLILLQNMSM